MSIKNNIGTFARLWEAFDFQSLTLAVLVVLGFIITLTMFLSGPLSAHAFGWWIALFSGLLVMAFCRPVYAMAKTGFQATLAVCVSVSFVFLSGIFGFFYSYYLVVGDLESGAGHPYSKLLDLPVTLVALWVAGLGWYITFQHSRRGHRTSHAVSLVLGTRTNAEFLKHSVTVRRYLPTKDDVDAVSSEYYGVDALKKANAIAGDGKDKILNDAESIASLKYMLNYYEFVAVGIEAGDIEEQLVYEALGEHVIKLFDRGHSVRAWIRKEGQEPLAWCHLENIVERWRRQSNEDRADQVRMGC